MLIMKFQQGHGFTTAGTFKWVVTEGGSDTLAPAVERKIAFVFLLAKVVQGNLHYLTYLVSTKKQIKFHMHWDVGNIQQDMLNY